MTKSLNRAQLIGNLGKDPEIRRTQDGDRMATFSLATSETYTDKATGETREYTQWHKIAVKTDGLSGVVEKFLRKGSKVYVEGQIESRKWTDDQGVERVVCEIVLRGKNSKLLLLDPFQPNPGSEPLTEAETATALDDEITY